MYAVFVLVPCASTIQYSFFKWNGVGPATWVGLKNYVTIFQVPNLIGTVINAFWLVVWFSFIPVGLGLVVASVIHRVATGRFGAIARTVLFLPQVIPLVAAGIIWGWLLALPGLINQILKAVGLGALTRAWLGDFDMALPAVGIVGIWVLLGFCIVLLLTGMSKIDPALYESARIDGAGWFREFVAITVPLLRYEIGVCLTVTVVAALAAFDIIWVTTAGGPGNSTSVPGIQIYILAFTQRAIGLASALAVMLMVLVVLVIIPIQWLSRESTTMKVARGELWAGRALLLVLMAFTILPFISIFMTALHPSGTVPGGLEWPANPQWINFVTAWNQAEMPKLLASSLFIVLAVVPVSLVISTMAGFAIGLLRIPGSRVLLFLFVFGLTLPFAGIIIPIYFLERAMGIYNTRLAIVLPLIALYMPFAVFWMRAHFVNMPSRDLGGGPRRWRDHLGPVLADPRPARAGADRVARNPHVHLDVEPVSPLPGARRRPDAANDGRRAGSVPGPLRERCPPVVRRHDSDPGTHPRRLHPVPAPDHHGAAPRLGQGMSSGPSSGVPSVITFISNKNC